MKKRVLKKSFILLAALGMVSITMNAQDSTFDANTDALWTTAANWTAGLPTGIATIQKTVDLNGTTQTITKVVTDNSTPAEAITFTNGTITLSGGSNTVLDNERVNTVTYSCNVNMSTTNGILENVAGANSKLIFANGSTLAGGGNRIKLRNFSAENNIELNGTVTGTNAIELMGGDTNNGWGGVTFGATSNFTGFTGNYFLYRYPIVSNSPTVFLNAANRIQFANIGGSLTVNVANTLKGEIRRINWTGGAGNSTVTFNANQTGIAKLTLWGEKLTFDFHSSVTEVSFLTNSITAGLPIDLKNYKSGVLKFDTNVAQDRLDSWLLDGVEPADGTIIRDADGYIRLNVNSTAGQDINWEDTTSWEGGALPQSGDNVTIKGKLLINSDVTVGALTINAPAAAETVSLQVTAGKSLTVNGAVTTSNDLFANSTSSSFGSIIINGTISGQIQYYRWVNATPNNDLIAVATTETVGDFTTNGYNSARLFSNAASGDGNTKLFGPFNNNVSGGSYTNYHNTTDAAVALVAGKGYRAASVTGGRTLRFKQNSITSTTATFNIAITDESGSNATSGLWNLIGNSYPSYINFTSFYNANSAQFDGTHNGVYGYDGDGTFTTYNLANKPTGDKISPLQGFFVKSKAMGGSVTFNPAWREIGTQDDFIAGRTEDRALAKLNLSDGTKSYNTSVYFIKNLTKGLDIGYDAGAFFQQNKGIFTHMLEGDVNTPMAIQGLDYNDFKNVVLPIGLKAAAGVPLTISLDAASRTVPSNINIYLEDKEDNSFTLLSDGDYTFTPSAALDGADRFNIHFTESVLSAQSLSLNKLQIYTSTGSLFVKGDVLETSKVSIFDIKGRLVISKNLDSSLNSNKLNVSKLVTGVYIVKVNNGKQTETKKVIIK